MCIHYFEIEITNTLFASSISNNNNRYKLIDKSIIHQYLFKLS